MASRTTTGEPGPPGSPWYRDHKGVKWHYRYCHSLFFSMAVNADRSDKSCAKAFSHVMLCNLMCNLLEYSGANEANKTLQNKLESLIAVLKNSSLAVPAVPVSSASCKELYEKHKFSKSQVYPLMFGSQKIPVYCHMGNFGCGGGGRLREKIDGKKKTFHYDSALWSNKHAYNLQGGKTGFDFEETKLPTYWNTSFTKICLGMKIPGQPIQFLVINKQAQSLHSLIADGKYRSTSLSRNTWKTVIGSLASLQANCSMEGFNATSVRHSRARIGIIGNNESDCPTPDSKIGFGNGGHHDNLNSCGNFAINQPSSDNGSKNIKAVGYILVQ
ncbi:uncharacterized skeletal organic matrix protein 5-like [Montipora foliosa]|uniref:uncharacterized skeletal organic matrix protein 5-like n=1 Tax=Montipora foliosa TaxID=591990 RepID=UPI0035F1DAB2